MTTIVSRLYQDAASAEAVLQTLQEEDATSSGASIITKAKDAEAQMTALDVPEASAAVYAPHVNKGAALLVVRAEFAPIGIAQKIIGIVDDADPMDVGIAKENAYLAIEPDPGMFDWSVMRDHRKFATWGSDGRKRGLVSQAFGWPMVMKHRYYSLSPQVLRNKRYTPTPHLLKDKFYSMSPRTISNGPITGGFMKTISRR